jgi:hypothetical protein
MALIKRIQLEESYVRVPNETAQHCEDELSLQAVGLLVNIMSYSESWELHKTELYKRYAKNKETSVRNAWEELVKAGYIIEFKYRVGKVWEYEYYVRLLPFTPKEKAEILDTARSEHSEIWGLDFPDLKMKTSKSRGNQEELTKEEPTKEELHKDNKQDIDDDKRTESSAIHNEEELNEIINCLREASKDELTDRSFKSVLRKVMDKYNQGKIGEGKFRDYLVTSLTNKIDDLEKRRIKEEAKSAMKEEKVRRTKAQIEKQLSTHEFKQTIPFYNWLED